MNDGKENAVRRNHAVQQMKGVRDCDVGGSKFGLASVRRTSLPNFDGSPGSRLPGDSAKGSAAAPVDNHDARRSGERGSATGQCPDGGGRSATCSIEPSAVDLCMITTKRPVPEFDVGPTTLPGTRNRAIKTSSASGALVASLESFAPRASVACGFAFSGGFSLARVQSTECDAQ